MKNITVSANFLEMIQALITLVDASNIGAECIPDIDEDVLWERWQEFKQEFEDIE